MQTEQFGQRLSSILETVTQLLDSASVPYPSYPPRLSKRLV